MHTFHTKIVGVTYQNPDGTKRQKFIKKCRVGESLELVRDPKNRYDPRAIEVQRMNGEQLGYLSRDVAGELAPLLDEDRRFEVEISDLTGGLFKSRGVNISIEEIR